jgi:hypothetical protein
MKIQYLYDSSGSIPSRLFVVVILIHHAVKEEGTQSSEEGQERNGQTTSGQQLW